MEFSNFYANIKAEEAAAATAAGWDQQRHQQKVNPFMQWAVASISGIYFGGPAAAHPADQSGRRFFSLLAKVVVGNSARRQRGFSILGLGTNQRAASHPSSACC